MTNCKKGIEPEKLEMCEENTSKYDILEYYNSIFVSNISVTFYALMI